MKKIVENQSSGTQMQGGRPLNCTYLVSVSRSFAVINFIPVHVHVPGIVIRPLAPRPPTICVVVAGCCPGRMLVRITLVPASAGSSRGAIITSAMIMLPIGTAAASSATKSIACPSASVSSSTTHPLYCLIHRM